jgi:hypothetical protein
VKEHFCYAGTDVGIDHDRSSLKVTDTGMLTAELRAATLPPGSKDWALYPPLLYFRNIPLARFSSSGVLAVDDEVLDEYDIALYMLEHHDILGTLTYRSGVLTFVGIFTTYVNDKGTSIDARWTAP